MCYADFLKGPPETNERQSGYELHLYYRLWCYFYAAMNQADSKLGPCCLLQHIPKLRKIFSFGAHTPSLQHRRVKFVVHESSLRRLLHAKVPNGIDSNVSPMHGDKSQSRSPSNRNTCMRCMTNILYEWMRIYCLMNDRQRDGQTERR